MSMIDCGQDIPKIILNEIKNNFIILPGEITLHKLSLLSKGQHSPQVIGMSFSTIHSILLKHNIESRKCGTPVRLQLKKQ